LKFTKENAKGFFSHGADFGSVERKQQIIFAVTSDYLGNIYQTLASLQKHLKDNVSGLRMSL
jgi:hypothetical protein